MLRNLLFFSLVAAATPLRAQSREVPDRRLEARLQELVRGFKGDVGIYVRYLRTGRTAAINADSVFPPASMIKVPILVATFDRLSRGELA